MQADLVMNVSVQKKCSLPFFFLKPHQDMDTSRHFVFAARTCTYWFRLNFALEFSASLREIPVLNCLDRISQDVSYVQLCVRYFGERERERERDTEKEREIDGSDVTIVALKLAMNLHLPLPKIRTFRFSLHTSRLSLHGEVTMVALKFAMSHTFHCQKIFRPRALFPPLSNGTSRATSDRKPKTKDQILPSPILFFPSKN